jgi:hypothetical protein
VSDRWPGPAPRPVRGVAALAVGLVLAALLAGGCASLPSCGQPQSAATLPPQGGGISPCCRVLVQPPQPGWPPAEVVRNFLLASTDSAHNYRVAREYLTGPASQWQPGSQVTILSRTNVTAEPGRVTGPAGKAIVLVTGQQLATLNSSGQYIPAVSSGTPSEEFILQSVNGIDKIADLPGTIPGQPSRGLLLTSALFQLAYTPRDIYYYGMHGGQLLPDPVYVPIQSADPVSTLVNDLRRDPAGLLGGVARTYLPAGARLAGVQVFPGLSGRTAIVDIALPHGAADGNVAKMAAQLVSTLTSPVFSPPLFHAVRLRINGRLWPAHGPAQSLASYQGDFPHWRRGINVYYVAQDGGVRVLGPSWQRSEPLANSPGVSQPALSQVAVSPDGRYLAGLGGPATKVYTGGLTSPTKPGQRPSAGQLHAQFTGRFTSLSWDKNDNLWVAGWSQGTWGIWVLVHGQGPAELVQPPNLSGEPVNGVRVAPDGVRVAMIVGTGTKAQVWLAAIRGPSGGFEITQPVPLGGQGGTQVLTNVTSYDEDHLLVTAGPPNAAQLWEVPVDGDNPVKLAGPAGITSVTAAGPNNPFYVALTGDKLERAVGPGQLLQPLQSITAGQAPSYPG